jgi:predicted phosphodiesterase
MKILATGDLHLGRRPARLPAEAAEDLRLGTAAAWTDVVEAALTAGADVVALAGDVVDRENRFYEALGPLAWGIRRLAEAGVDVVAVAGNHDFDVLPRLAEEVASPRFHLLGRGGRWERAVLGRGGEPTLAVDGWSFPREHVREDPLPAYDLAPETRLPTLGLLHTEVDAKTSPYAPTTTARLRARPATLWVLGHRHAPGLLPGAGTPLLYPGSPLALGSGERGRHGPWRVTLAGRLVEAIEPLALSRVRYETVTVEVGGVEGREQLDARVAAGLRAALAAAAGDGGGRLVWLVARLALAGRASLKALLPGLAAEAQDLRLRDAGATASVDGLVDETRPAVDLGELARAFDPAGCLAATLLRLERGEEGTLARQALARMVEVHGGRPYARLAGLDPPPDLEAAHACLLAAGYRLLEALLAQRSFAGGEA